MEESSPGKLVRILCAYGVRGISARYLMYDEP